MLEGSESGQPVLLIDFKADIILGAFVYRGADHAGEGLSDLQRRSIDGIERVDEGTA